MLTTRRPDGHLESRAMANQKRADGADLWFVTAEGTSKLRDIEHDPHVNGVLPARLVRVGVGVGYREPVAGPRQDSRALRARLEGWFGQEGDPRHGTADDPRIVLIGIDVHAAVFLEVNKPKPVVLFELAKGWLTGERVEPGEIHELREPHR